MLGMGNTLAGDDGVGIHVVRVVAERMAAGGRSDVVVEETSESYFALLDYIGRYDRILVVDAWRAAGHKVGDVHCFDIGPTDAGACTAGSHGMGLASVVGLARQLCPGATPRVTVVAVTVRDEILLTEGLSPPAAAAVERAADAVERELGITAEAGC